MLILVLIGLLCIQAIIQIHFDSFGVKHILKRNEKVHQIQ